MNEDRKKALDAALNQIEKQYGKGAIMKLGEKQNELNKQLLYYDKRFSMHK